MTTITLEREFVSKHCMLFCSTCGITTNHVLGKSGQYYSCACGTVIDIEYVEKEDENE